MTCRFRHTASFIACEHTCLVTDTPTRGVRKVFFIRQVRDGVSTSQHMVTNSCDGVGVGRLTGWGFSTTQQPSLCQNSLMFPDGSSFRPLPEAPGGSWVWLPDQSSHSGVTPPWAHSTGEVGRRSERPIIRGLSVEVGGAAKNASERLGREAQGLSSLDVES